MPEVASRRHLELVAPVVREALGEAGATLDDVDRIAVTQGPGPDRRAARRPRRGEGDRVVAPPAARARRPPRRARRLALSPAGRARAAVSLPARERRPHAAARRARPHASSACSARRSTTPRARRSTRARGCSASAIPAAARSTGSRATATRRRTTSRSRACPASTSRSPASRRRCSTRRATSPPAELEARRADLAASYQRAIVRALVGRVRTRGADGRDADRGRRRRRRELRAPRGARRRRRSRRSPLCTDNAAMIASAGRFTDPVPYPGYLGLDAYASR